jgi:hypothetical protein
MVWELGGGGERGGERGLARRWRRRQPAGRSPVATGAWAAFVGGSDRQRRGAYTAMQREASPAGRCGSAGGCGRQPTGVQRLRAERRGARVGRRRTSVASAAASRASAVIGVASPWAAWAGKNTRVGVQAYS